MDDDNIVELFLCRNEDAIKESASKYGGRLRSISYGIVEDFQTSQECENSAYMEAWNLIPPNEPRAYLFAFLARIIRHISLNVCRERNTLKRSAYICELSNEMQECIPASDDCEHVLDDIILKEILNDYLAHLSSNKRNIFLRRYWYMDSIASISKRFSISESKVKTTLFRCREGLRKHLEKEGYSI